MNTLEIVSVFIVTNSAVLSLVRERILTVQNGRNGFRGYSMDEKVLYRARDVVPTVFQKY